MLRTISLSIFLLLTPILSAQVWDSLGAGASGPIYTLYWQSANNSLLVGGAFTSIGQTNAANLANWENGNWQSPGLFNDTVHALLSLDNLLFAGGGFTQVNGQVSNGLAQRINGQWQPISGIDNGSVTALQGYENGVAIGGTFTTINGQSFSHIALWNGATWEPLGSGLNGPVEAMATLNNELYAAGNFTQAGTTTVNGMARWNGAAWEAVPGIDFGKNGGAIHSLTVWFGRLYAGGCFDSLSNKAANNIALFDGQQWFPLGDGTNDCVYALKGLDDLYIGGAFTLAGGEAHGRLAKWTGSSWTSAQGDFDGPVYALEGSSSQLFVAGQFTTVANDKGVFTVNNIARFDFTTGIDNPLTKGGLNIFPNPATTQIAIATPPTLVRFTILLIDMQGRPVLRHEVGQPGTTVITVDHLPAGVYLLHVLEDNIRQASGRLVLTR